MRCALVLLLVLVGVRGAPAKKPWLELAGILSTCATDGGVETLRHRLAPSLGSLHFLDRLRESVRWVEKRYGRMGDPRIVRESADGVRATIEYAVGLGHAVLVDLRVDQRGRVTWIRFDPVARKFKSVRDVFQHTKDLADSVSCCVLSLGDPKPLARLGEDRQVYVASLAKLFVHASTVERIRSKDLNWSDIVLLDDKHRSISSGDLNDWPAGAPLTISTLSTLMLSISDNTATDHLIHKVGRGYIEKSLVRSGHSDPRGMVPFLSTGEAWKLRSGRDGSLAGEYVKASEQKKRDLLRTKVADVKFVDVGEPIADEPSSIQRKVGWRASSADISRCLLRILELSGKNENSHALRVLGVFPSVEITMSPEYRKADYFQYQGHKDGTGSQHLSFASLLKTDQGWFAICMVLENDRDPLDTERINALYARAVQLIGTGRAK